MKSSSIGIAVAYLALVVACETTPASTSAETSTGEGTSTTARDTSTSSTTDDADTSSSTSGSSSSSGLPDHVPPGFLNTPDLGEWEWECSSWQENCPPGEKCMPYANDGGNAWNAMRCAPIAPDPKRPGEPCTVEGSGVSGIDDCEQHSMCWDVDDETLEGTCVAMCIGSESAPACADVDAYCTISSGGELNLCLPICDPLAQDCEVGEGCYPNGASYSCVPDASGKDGGAFEVCQFTNGCDPGFACSSAPVCDPQGCCVPFCSLSDPACPDGTACIPWLEAGQEPFGLEDVGVCGGAM